MEVTEKFSTLETARDYYRQSADSRWIALGLSILLLLLSTGLFYELITGRVRSELVGNLEVFTPAAFATGALLCYVFVRNVQNPGYSTVAVSPDGVVFESFRNGRLTRVSWSSGPVRLRLDRRNTMGGALFLDTSDRVSLKALTEEAFLAILESARGAGLSVSERRIWAGLVTRFDIVGKKIDPGGPGA